MLIALYCCVYLQYNYLQDTLIMEKISNQRVEKIARNINAMDVYFEYSDDFKVYKFWRNLKKKLETILENLTDADRKLVISLCEADKRKYFNLI